MASSNTWRVELACFSVLLMLVAVQVVIYRYADEQDQKYGLDKAQLVIYYHGNSEGDTQWAEKGVWLINVSYTSDNCYQCVPYPLGAVARNRSLTVQLDTTYPATITLTDTNSSKSWSVHRHYEEASLYQLTISMTTKDANISVTEVESGRNSFLPILYASVVLVVVACVCAVGGTLVRHRERLLNLFRNGPGVGVASEGRAGLVDSNIQTNDIKEVQDPFESMRATMPGSGSNKHGDKKKRKKKGSSRSASPASILIKGTQEGPVASPPSEEDSKDAKKKRLQSLDTFRGFSLVIMIFVNYGGGGYWFFNHSRWNGLTVADLVFPWFVWIMGVSLVFSFKGRDSKSVFYQVYLILKRTVILFSFGLFLISNTGGDEGVSLSTLRICGVLQRLAATYCATAIIEVIAQLVYKRVQLRMLPGLSDVCFNWFQFCMGALITLLWVLFTFLISEDGCPRGYLGPGGIGDNFSYPTCTGGAAAVIDRWILGEKHMYGSFTGKKLYHATMRYEPEGILGTLTSIVLCILGVQAGKIVLYFKDNHRDILIRLVAWGMTLCTLAALLCLGQKNGGIIPVNKNLWSLSFIFLLAGFGYLLLAAFYVVIDVYPLWNGAPFKYTGMNSIMIYLGHEILHPYFPFSFYHQNHTHLTFLSSNLIAVSIWVLISYYWFAINFFVKF